MKEYRRINTYNPFTGEEKSYYGVITKETKRYMTIEINPDFTPCKHHCIAKIHKDLITNIL